MATGMAINDTWREFGFPGYVPYNRDRVSRGRCGTHSGQLTLPLIIHMPHGGGIKALEHHSARETRAHSWAGVVPSTPYDAKGLLSAIR